MPTLLDDLPAIEEREPELTVLSYGGGQDSDAIKLKLAYDDGFRRRYAPRRLLMLMSDTGDEHAETLAHLEYTKEFCRRHAIEFHHITPDLGFHRASWQSLAAFYRRTETCGMNAGRKSCTENLKLAPLYNFLERWIAENYGTPFGKKIAFHRFSDRHGPVRMLIGIAKGEEKRVAKPRAIPRWRRASIEQRYPLIEIGYDRALCQQFIRSLGEPVPLPSNCMRCPWLSMVELLWLARFRRWAFDEWVEMERAKLRKFAHHGTKNYGVFKGRTLAETLALAEAKYGHMTDRELHLHKMSHGHCVRSAY